MLLPFSQRSQINTHVKSSWHLPQRWQQNQNQMNVPPLEGARSPSMASFVSWSNSHDCQPRFFCIYKGPSFLVPHFLSFVVATFFWVYRLCSSTSPSVVSFLTNICPDLHLRVIQFGIEEKKMSRAHSRKVHFAPQSPELLYALSAQEYDRSAVEVSRLTYKDMEELIRLRGEYRRAHDQMMEMVASLDFDSDASSSTSEGPVLSWFDY